MKIFLTTLAILTALVMGFVAGYKYYDAQVGKIYEDGSFAGCQHNAPCQD